MMEIMESYKAVIAAMRHAVETGSTRQRESVTYVGCGWCVSGEVVVLSEGG